MNIPADEAADRCLEQALREEFGGDAAPDLAAAVRRRAAAGDWPVDVGPPRARWWLAAGIAAGIAVAVGTAVLVRSREPRAVPAAAPQDPQPTPVAVREPEWRTADTPGAVEGLDASCVALRLRTWIEDAERGGGTPAPTGVASALNRTPRLQQLDLDADGQTGPRLTEADLHRIGEQTSLRELRLTGRAEIEPSWLKALAGLPALTTLAMPHVAIGDEGAEALARCPSLQTLELAFDGTLTDAGVASLATLADLRSLSLRGCGRLTTAGLQSLAACRRLERLDVCYCAGIGGGARRPLPARVPLRTLETMLTVELVLASKPGGGADDAALLAFATLPGLRELLVTGCPSITTQGLAAVAKLPLRRLALSIRGGDALETVGLLPPTLEDLSLAWSSVFDDAAAATLGKRLPQLRRLDLFQCTALTDAGLAKLLADTAIVELDLRGCKLLTEASFPVLLQTKRLEVLDVSGQNWLTVAGRELLGRMPAMRELKCHIRSGLGPK